MKNLDLIAAAMPHLGFEEPEPSHAMVAPEHDASDPFLLREDVEAACARIAPLWTLRSFVAVNPYLGWSGTHFDRAAGEVEHVLHGRSSMPLDYYALRMREGAIHRTDVVAAACEHVSRSPDWSAWVDAPERLADLLIDELQSLGSDAEAVSSPSELGVATVAEALDRRDGGALAELVEQELGRFLAGRFDAGQAAWPQPGRELPLLVAWRRLAIVDRSLEIRGVPASRAYFASLPDKPLDVIAHVLDQLPIGTEGRREFLVRQLASIGGWASHVQRLVRDASQQGREDDSLWSLLAIRLAYDGALASAYGIDGAALGAAIAPDARLQVDADRARRLLWQSALEHGYQRRLLSKLGGAPQPRLAGEPERPVLQAVFCIDVRSEVLRRKLEALDARIQTIGFAGFFGMPIAFQRLAEPGESARCPVLLSPSHRIAEVTGSGAEGSPRRSLARARHAAFTKLRKLTVGAFPLVETLGHGFGLRLVSDALGWTRPLPGGAFFEPGSVEPGAPSLEPQGDGTGVPLADRVDLAENALRNMGLTEGFAPVVLLCGHGSSSTNNPYASSLDCGACGGHPGDANARVACAILEDPAVRAGLRERGIDIPDDTTFVAGLHDTTADRVELLDADGLDPARRGSLEAWLALAGERTADERAARLGGGSGRALARRAEDWSEVRPEWGLAGNAAFIAAPRSLSRHLSLHGRSFLHDYDEARDPDGSVLELVLTAPLVVASWINLQYYASTVDNDVFGSGDKTIHNVTGRHGVLLGNGGDLQVGLPLQSVHDGERPAHEPMRLTAVVRASRSRIDAVLARHDDLRDLVENEWLHLVAWDPETGAFHRRVRAESGGWIAL